MRHDTPERAAGGLRFVKGHGTENDFVLLPDPAGQLSVDAWLVRAICDRRAGIGADGVLRVVRTASCPEVASLADEAEWFMDYRNADGSLAEMCGNGVRVYARFLVAAGYERPGTLRLATRHGVREVTVPQTGDVSVDMGVAAVDRAPVKVGLAGRELPATAVDIGNPHAVVTVDEPVAEVDLRPSVPVDRFPAGANVEVVNVLEPGRLRMRVYERGVGETRSCGTGACAAAAASGRRGRWVVEVPGGTLTVSWRGDSVVLGGPAVLVGEGELGADWLAAVTAESVSEEGAR